MRGFTDDQDDHTPDGYALSQETWRVKEDGEVELGPGEDTADTSPVSVEPSLSADIATDDRSNVENAPRSVNDMQEVSPVKLREPTPSLMSHIDPVSDT